jgi:hypothetical protein
MKNKFSEFGMPAMVLALGLLLIACGDKDKGDPTGPGGGDPPVFTLTNIDTGKQSEGSNWFIFGLFPTGTSAITVLADAKAHKSQSQPGAVVAYAGGNTNQLPWQGTPGQGPISISSTLTSTSDHQSIWNASGSYDGWVLVYNGNVWNGYKLAINVQGNVTEDAGAFVKTITNQN